MEGEGGGREGREGRGKAGPEEVRGRDGRCMREGVSLNLPTCRYSRSVY